MSAVFAIGVVAQLGLLAVLAGTSGLTAAGWLVGVTVGVTANALLYRGLARSRAVDLGRANAVTLTRATMVGGVTALVATGFTRPPAVMTLVSFAAVALVLDGVDGWVARHTGTVTAVGARFDMEVDAFLILVLSVHLGRTLSPWVLVIGGTRYLFLAAGRLLPWLRAPLPPRYWRKVVAAVQGVALTVAASGVLTPALAQTVLVGALALLLESFGHDVWWLATWRTAVVPKGAPSRRRRVVGQAGTVLAVVLLWAALVAPDRLSDLTVGTFARVPVEGLAFLAVALALPTWPRHVLAVVGGVALTVLVLIRALDVGFLDVLDRPFNPVTDWGSLRPAVGVLSDSVGRGKTMLLVAVAVLLVVAVLAAMTTAAVRVTGLVARHGWAASRSIVGLGVVAAVCAGLGVTTGGDASVASTSTVGLVTDQVRLVRAGLQDRDSFSARLTSADRFALTPGSGLLTGLRGKDVLVVFVESYGRVAVEGSTFSRKVDQVLADGTRQLRAAGWSSRSAFLTSPTFGGVSWLAHSTLQSGMWVDSLQRYRQITSSGRFTLSEAFKRAGWRTVFDIPSSRPPWPQGQALYHYDELYGSNDVGYAGPKFSYAKIPDQYTLDALYQRELAPSARKPVMAEVDLVSSHTPWAPLPRMVPWQDLGNGAIYDRMPAQGRRPAVVWRDRKQVQAAYGRSIQYSLTALISFLQTVRDDNLVLIVLGDHQPATVVSGEHASHDVPVTVIAHDPRVTDRIDSWDWDDGLLPSPTAPVWRMDTFRDRFLSVYGPTPPSTVRTVAPQTVNGSP